MGGLDRCPVLCPQLPAFDPANWAEIAAAFSQSESLSLFQGWRSRLEPAFQPGFVRMGVREGALWVYAELHDQDIYNEATASSQPLWQLGDVFEIFLHPGGQQTYFEFHVTPHNHTLALRWPIELTECLDYPDTTEPYDHYLFDAPALQTWTSIETYHWQVLARIDLKQVVELNEPQESELESEVAQFSFSRYDYTRAASKPVLSSTSPHREPAFHRRYEWTPMNNGDLL